jgi:hypothetical protein
MSEVQTAVAGLIARIAPTPCTDGYYSEAAKTRRACLEAIVDILNVEFSDILGSDAMRVRIVTQTAGHRPAEWQ